MVHAHTDVRLHTDAAPIMSRAMKQGASNLQPNLRAVHVTTRSSHSAASCRSTAAEVPTNGHGAAEKENAPCSESSSSSISTATVVSPPSGFEAVNSPGLDARIPNDSDGHRRRGRKNADAVRIPANQRHAATVWRAAIDVFASLLNVGCHTQGTVPLARVQLPDSMHEQRAVALPVRAVHSDLREMQAQR